MRKDVELELLAELRGYYLHYPHGHGVVDYHPEWKRGNLIWKRIDDLANQLQDNKKTYHRYIKTLKAEGLIKDL